MASSFHSALTHVAPCFQGSVFDYANPDDFSQLWRFSNLPAECIIVLWSETAPDQALWPIDTTSCLSPLDWAAAYVQSLNCDPEKWPEILILDLASTSRAGVPTVAHFDTIRPNQLPWLTLNKNPGLQDILDWHNSGKKIADEETYRADCKAALARFLREIRLDLTDVRTTGDYDRHSISNIVAPMLLLGRAAKLTLHSEALFKLLHACGLGAQEGPQTLSSDHASEDGTGLQILLVDDQAEHGWSDWLRKCLPNANIEVLTSPDRLVEELTNQLDATPGTSDLRFHFQLPALERAANPLLLLDLRLFSGKPRAEVTFYKDKLLPLIDRFKYRQDLAWPAFSSQDISFKTARSAVENAALKVESPEHHEVLTWLPRVVALADMSLPIVLFSSTGRRDLVEPFKHYGNIITSFEKPRCFDSRGLSVRESAIHALDLAISKARQISNAAAQLRAIQLLSLTQYNAAKAAFVGKTCIEIYHDESSDPNKDDFRVAAFAIGFASESEADAVNKYIHNHGPWFFGKHALHKVTAKEPGKRQWNDSIASPLRDALKAGDIGAAQLLPFVIVSGKGLKGKVIADSFSLVDPSGLDNVNQDLLRLLLEVMICDTLAWITEPKNCKCRFYGATRMRSQDSGNTQPSPESIYDELWARWRIDAGGQIYIEQDVKTREWTFLWPSLRKDSFQGLLNELVSARGQSAKTTAFCGGIVMAYGTSLPTQNRTGKLDGYRYLHSIADIVARLVDMDPLSGQASWDALAANPDLPLSLRGAARFRQHIIRILNCHRALDEGDLVDGFSYGLGVNHEHDVAGNVVALRLKTLVATLSGEEFRGIVRHVAEEGPRWTHSPRIPSKVAKPPRSIQAEQPKPLGGGVIIGGKQFHPT